MTPTREDMLFWMRAALLVILLTAVINVRALRHVISMRASDAADAEIRQMGCILLAIMLEELPAYFTDYKVGPASDGIGSTATTTRAKV